MSNLNQTSYEMKNQEYVTHNLEQIFFCNNQYTVRSQIWKGRVTTGYGLIATGSCICTGIIFVQFTITMTIFLVVNCSLFHSWIVYSRVFLNMSFHNLKYIWFHLGAFTIWMNMTNFEKAFNDNLITVDYT